MNSQRTTPIGDVWIVVAAIVMFAIILGVRKWGDQRYVAGYTEGYAQAEGYTRTQGRQNGTSKLATGPVGEEDQRGTKKVSLIGNSVKLPLKDSGTPNCSMHDFWRCLSNQLCPQGSFGTVRCAREMILRRFF